MKWIIVDTYWTLHVLIEISQQPYGTELIIILILQIRKLKHNVNKYLDQGNTASI